MTAIDSSIKTSINRAVFLLKRANKIRAEPGAGPRSTKYFAMEAVPSTPKPAKPSTFDTLVEQLRNCSVGTASTALLNKLDKLKSIESQRATLTQQLADLDKAEAALLQET